ncbi:MAG: DUF721 domain-containing protein [Bacteroidales bacterium]|nr:DUF721 domain-containing protein [Bacteroidales bacterium]
MDKNRVSRKEAIPLSEALKQFIQASRMRAPLNTQRIFAVWNDVSGAGPYTTRRFFRDGRLTVTVSSSVVRSQLYFQKDILLAKLNARLRQDELFISDGPWSDPVKELILK